MIWDFYINLQGLSMIKFTLIIWVCSFLGTPPVCMAPLQHPKSFDSWYECSKTGYSEASLMITKMGYKYVNDNRIAMNYSCRPVPTV
tara:strand:- start:120 stop:380 length:261 start_codon:yes stop_codon:yes gene_type:complete